jgi:ABC-type xylose transport system substrate-binding protein
MLDSGVINYMLQHGRMEISLYQIMPTKVGGGVIFLISLQSAIEIARASDMTGKERHISFLVSMYDRLVATMTKNMDAYISFDD